VFLGACKAIKSGMQPSAGLGEANKAANEGRGLRPYHPKVPWKETSLNNYVRQ